MSVLCSFIGWSGAAARGDRETQENTSLLYAQVLEMEGMACQVGSQGKTPGWSAGSEGEARAFVGFLGKGRTGLGRVSGLGQASLSNSRGLWATGVASHCLVPGPGMLERGILPLGTHRPDRGGRALDSLLCLLKSWPGPNSLLSSGNCKHPEKAVFL